MINVINIISDIFIAAMAVFGLWCAFQFIMLDISAHSRIRCAVRIDDSRESTERVGDMVCELDRSALTVREEKYPLLFTDKSKALKAASELSEELFDRVEFYVRIDIDKNGYFKDKE